MTGSDAAASAASSGAAAPAGSAGPSPHGDDSLYERLGGAGPLEALVDHFYRGVAEDATLRPLYPEDDLDGARQRLAAFLVQLTGGPRRYAELRGDPRLRMRHLAFPIGPAAAAAWLARMGDALAATPLPPGPAGELRAYFERTAAFLVNDGGLSLRGEAPAGSAPGT